MENSSKKIDKLISEFVDFRIRSERADASVIEQMRGINSQFEKLNGSVQRHEDKINKINLKHVKLEEEIGKIYTYLSNFSDKLNTFTVNIQDKVKDIKEYMKKEKEMQIKEAKEEKEKEVDELKEEKKERKNRIIDFKFGIGHVVAVLIITGLFNLLVWIIINFVGKM